MMTPIERTATYVLILGTVCIVLALGGCPAPDAAGPDGTGILADGTTPAGAEEVPIGEVGLPDGTPSELPEGSYTAGSITIEYSKEGTARVVAEAGDIVRWAVAIGIWPDGTSPAEGTLVLMPDDTRRVSETDNEKLYARVRSVSYESDTARLTGTVRLSVEAEAAAKRLATEAERASDVTIEFVNLRASHGQLEAEKTNVVYTNASGDIRRLPMNSRVISFVDSATVHGDLGGFWEVRSLLSSGEDARWVWLQGLATIYEFFHDGRGIAMHYQSPYGSWWFGSNPYPWHVPLRHLLDVHGDLAQRQTSHGGDDFWKPIAVGGTRYFTDTNFYRLEAMDITPTKGTLQLTMRATLPTGGFCTGFCPEPPYAGMGTTEITFASGLMRLRSESLGWDFYGAVPDVAIPPGVELGTLTSEAAAERERYPDFPELVRRELVFSDVIELRSVSLDETEEYYEEDPQASVSLISRWINVIPVVMDQHAGPEPLTVAAGERVRFSATVDASYEGTPSFFWGGSGRIPREPGQSPLRAFIPQGTERSHRTIEFIVPPEWVGIQDLSLIVYVYDETNFGVDEVLLEVE